MLNIGIIGVGGIANGVHIPEILKSPDAKLLAICDCNKDTLKKVGDKYGIDEKYRFESHLDLINCPDVDAIEICTPNHLHVPFAVDAVKAGKPFNLEKPLSINYTEAEKLKKALEEKPVPNMMCFSYRFRPAVRYAKELIDKGVIGDIINVKVEYFKDSAFMPGRKLEWRFIKEYAGTGVLGDLGVHLIDLAEFLMGDITSVCAKKDVVVKKRPLLDGSGEGDVETDDYCMFLAEFNSGAVGVFNITRCAYGNGNTIAFEIFGTKGSWNSFDHEIKDREGNVIWKFDKELEDATYKQKSPYVLEHSDAITKIRQGIGLDEAQACAISSLVGVMGRESAYTGKTVTWDEISQSDLDLMPEKLEIGPMDMSKYTVKVPGSEQKK